MAHYYRVHPFLPGTTEGEPGSATFVPAGRATGRIGNTEYDTLYVADSAAGAIAEAFGDFAVWNDELFEVAPHLSGYHMAVSTYEGDLSVVDLNDPTALVEFGYRPSRIVTRHRFVTQAWALAIFRTRAGSGVRWWSYHDPDWGSLGLWDLAGLSTVETVPLNAMHPAFIEASSIMRRPYAP